MLNVVNFGGGAYVIYAEVLADGEIEVDPEPYSDTSTARRACCRSRPRRWWRRSTCIGDHIPEGSLASAREKIVARSASTRPSEGLQIVAPAAATTPSSHDVELAVHRDPRCSSSSTGSRPRTSSPTRVVEPYALINGARGLVRRRVGPQPRRRCALPAGPHQARRGAGGALRAAARGRTRSADDRAAGRAPARSPARARARVLDLPRAGALGARGAHGAGRARRRRDRRRDHLQGRGLPRPRGAQGGRRRGRARAADAREAVLAAAEGLQ